MSLLEHRSTGPRTRTREVRKPDFIVRTPDPSRKGKWLSCGAAWAREDGDGYNIKLTVLPVSGFDGALVLLPPLAQEEDQSQD